MASETPWKLRTSASQSKSAGVSWSRTAALVLLSAHRERRSAREKSGAPIAASSLTCRMSWSITLHGLAAGVAHAQTLPAVGRGSSIRSEVRGVRCRRRPTYGRTGNALNVIGPAALLTPGQKRRERTAVVAQLTFNQE